MTSGDVPWSARARTTLFCGALIAVAGLALIVVVVLAGSEMTALRLTLAGGQVVCGSLMVVHGLRRHRRDPQP